MRKQCEGSGPNWAILPTRAYGFLITSIHLWVRCGVCRKMNDYDKHSGVCSCGQRLPEAPSYF